MSLIHLFTGPPPEKLEAQGDRLLDSGQWGQAKLVYERAIAKCAKTAGKNSAACRRLGGKIQKAREALAREHLAYATSYHEGGYLEEARESLALALEISRDEAFRKQCSLSLAALEDRPAADFETLPHAAMASHREGDFASNMSPTKREHFQVLCNTLPDAVAKAYRSYGEDFMDGFLALNNGEFDRAAALLEGARATAPPDSYIPLELATAYLNTGRMPEARKLLEGFCIVHPDALPAYQLLCEIYWEQKDFARAEALLDTLPAELAQSRAGMLLKGETLHRAGDYHAARDFYERFLATYGWDEGITAALARTLEALHEPHQARRLYREIIERGRGCRGHVDAGIRHRYAELAFAEGHRGEDILEIYLTLTREAPDQAAIYFDRISRIYLARGNTAEGRRFREFARRARFGQNPPTPS